MLSPPAGPPPSSGRAPCSSRGSSPSPASCPWSRGRPSTSSPRSSSTAPSPCCRLSSPSRSSSSTPKRATLPPPGSPASPIAHGQGGGVDQALGHLSLLAELGAQHLARVPARAAPRELDRRLPAHSRAPRGLRGGAPRASRRSRPAARAERRRLRGADPLPRAPPLRAARVLGERHFRFAQRGLPRRGDRGRPRHRGGSLVRGARAAALVAQPCPPCLLDLRR